MWTFCCCCYLQGQGHSKGSYDQNMTVSTILSELFYSLATKLDLMIHHQQLECPMKKRKEGITAFRVKVTVKGHNVNVCPEDIF